MTRHNVLFAALALMFTAWLVVFACLSFSLTATLRAAPAPTTWADAP